MLSNKNLAAYLAALWSLLFGTLHVFWAVGIYWFLPKEAAKQAFDRNWFYAYNLIAAVLLLFAFALAIVLCSNTIKWKKAALLLGWFCAGILILRSVSAVIFWLYFSIASVAVVSAISIWDLWFLTGGILFLLSVLGFQKSSSGKNFKH